MPHADSDRGGPTFPTGCTVEVMDSRAGPAVSQDGSGVLLEGLVHGERARALRAQLASRHPRRSAEEIEEAVQAACESFLDQEEVITDPAPLYAWIRTVAHRALVREDDHRKHELAVDPIEGILERAVSEERGPAEELIALEDDLDLELLVREVAASLSGRRREILALWGTGHKRPEIASCLGMSERAVKRDLIAIMEEARAAVARRAGGGCESGEALMLRFVYGLASAAEAEQARLHLGRCHRCAAFSEQMGAWREKAGALLPAPAAIEQASPGVLERVAHRATDGIASVKQQILGGGAQLKQQAAATSSRTVDPTPFAGVRPGAVAAVVAGCIAVGSGATYCAQQGVDPLGAAKNLIAGTQESEPPPGPQPSPEPAEPAPVIPPVSEEPPVTETPEPEPSAEEVEQPAAPEHEPQPPPQPAPEPEPEPQPEPEPEPEPAPPPPPEQSFEPASPEYPASEPAPESPPPAKAQPAAVPAHESPQFGGP